MTKNRLEQILTGLGIRYTPTQKALNINCPWCVGSTHGRRDTQLRCGIFPTTRSFHCFRCKRKGSLYEIFQAMFGMSVPEYMTLIGTISMPDGQSTQEIIAGYLNPVNPTRPKQRLVSIPTSRRVSKAVLVDHPILARFLKRRWISLDMCIRGDSRYTGDGGDYPQRLIIPVIDRDGDLGAWQARDVTGKSKRKYLTEGDISQLLYRMPFHDPRRIYVVEGVFDCWRMEENTVASFTHGISSRQRSLLLNCGADEIVFAWDSDSFDMALGAAQEIAPLVDHAGAIRLPDGEDPDSLGAEAVRDLPVRWV